MHDRNNRLIPSRPPKLRFYPGMFVELGKQLYEIVYAYRVKGDHQWKFCLEERESLCSVEERDKINQALVAAGVGNETHRIIYDLFRNTFDAFQFFSDIPLHGDRRHVGNKTMVQEAKIVSSGEVVTAKSKAELIA